MKVEKGNIVTLSDDIQYIVLSRVEYDNKNYLYLTSMEEEPKIKICCENKENDVLKLCIVTDIKLINKLILLFDNDIQSIL